jgi:uncharacterized membrane protein
VSRPTRSGDRGATNSTRVALPGLMIGIGVAGTLDEVILHQLLRWHHFYDRSTSAMGLVSDGVFHAVSTAALVGGLVILLKRRFELGSAWRRPLGGWILLGAGGFNLYDGTIQHKVLGLHQVREGASSQVPYDVAFIAIALGAVLIGLAILGGTRRRHR